jgi:hypothetical protein
MNLPIIHRGGAEERRNRKILNREIGEGFFFLFTFHFSLFTFHFSLFTFHFSLFTFLYERSPERDGWMGAGASASGEAS